MSPLVLAVISAAALVAILAMLFTRSERTKRSYYVGVNVWAQWLPVFATGLYLSVLVVNLANFGNLNASDLNLAAYLSIFEMIFMLLVGPLFLTRWGNLVATIGLIYLCQKAIGAHSFARGDNAIQLLLASLTIIAVLGDRVPWLAGDQLQRTAQRLRDILMVGVATGALAVVAAAIVNYGAFSRWFNTSFATQLASQAMLAALAALFIGWILIALGLARHFMMPVVTLPTLLALTYFTGLPVEVMVVPFTACLALALATTDRRVVISRRQSVYRTGYLPTR